MAGIDMLHVPYKGGAPAVVGMTARVAGMAVGLGVLTAAGLAALGREPGGAVLAAISSLGRSLGFRVAGQGVETIEHAQLLRAAGCSEAQGYYFSRPVDAAAIQTLLLAKAA